MDPQVCFLRDTSAVPYNSISASHRKVVTYIAFADNQVSRVGSICIVFPTCCASTSTDSSVRPGQENTEKEGGTIGHGTHVATTVVGNSRTKPESNGLAQAGKVAFFDIAKYDSQRNIQLYPPGTHRGDAARLVCWEGEGLRARLSYTIRSE